MAEGVREGMAAIQVLSVGPSACVPDECKAIDADVLVDGIEGSVTLKPRESDGVLDSWGRLEHWVSPNLYQLDGSTLDEVVKAVRAAA